MRREWRQRRQAEAALAAALSTPAAPAVCPGAKRGGLPASRLQHGSSAEMDSLPSQRQAATARALSVGSAPGGSQVAAGRGRSSGGSSGAGDALCALRCLLPEARAVLLLSQPAEQRRRLLAGMTDADRAALAVQLDESARLQASRAGGPHLAASPWSCTEGYNVRKPA